MDSLSELVRAYDRRRNSAETLKRLERPKGMRLVCPKCRRAAPAGWPSWSVSRPCGCGVEPVEVSG